MGEPLKRTVLMVTPYFPPEGGGLERYAKTIATKLAEDFAWRVVFVTSGHGPTVKITDEDGFRVYRLPTQLTLSRTPLSAAWPRMLAKIVRDEHAVLINAHAPVPGLADAASMAAPSVPFVLTYHAGPMHKGRPLQDRVIWLYEQTLLRRMARRSTTVICNSRFVQAAFGREFAGKSVVIPPGVDTSLYSPGGTARPGSIIFVAQMDPGMEFKGLDLLIEATRVLVDRGQDVTLEVVGTGDLVPGYESLARGLGLGSDRVSFSGYLSGQDLVDAYRRSAVAALPSGNESFGMSLAEAMACGLPVVASRTGGIPDVVDDGTTGLLVTHGAVDQLADALGSVIDDPELAGRLGRAGRVRVERNFDWAVRARNTDALFEETLAARPANKTVAIVTPRYPPDVGGVERYSSQIAEGLAASDALQPLVISTRAGVRTTYTYRNGVPVVRLGAWLKLSNTPFSPLWPLQVRRLLAAHRVELINAHSPVPGLADAASAVSGGRPVVFTYHSGSMLKGARFADLAIGAYERRILPRIATRADAIAVVSPTTQISSYEGAIMVPPSVDLDAFSFKPEDATSVLRLLFVGRIDGSATWKGERVLFDALAMAATHRPDIELEIVGDGDGRRAWEDEVGRRGIGPLVHFSGMLGGEELVAAYHRSSIVVLPSTTEAESFGMCLIEAMACGRAVIGSRIGGIPFVVGHGTDGVLVPPGDAAALAAAVVELGGAPERRAAMGVHGRRKAEARFSIHGLQNTYEKLFKDMLT
jgi:glycosyltransferase involved in cell wall biosynthesis